MPRRIVDPFISYNELDCQWVGDSHWTYRTRLPVLSTDREYTHHVLAFDGLDTLATVRLDGQVILESFNMFVQHRVDITTRLRPDPVDLEIEFRPAFAEGRRVQSAHPDHQWVGSNGDMSRLAVRKAQYHWG